MPCILSDGGYSDSDVVHTGGERLHDHHGEDQDGLRPAAQGQERQACRGPRRQETGAFTLHLTHRVNVILVL